MKSIPIIFTLLIFLTGTIEISYAQVNDGLLLADSLYRKKNWVAAKSFYEKYLGDSSGNSMYWNRLGFCNQNLGMYTVAMVDYKKSIAKHPNPQVKSSAMSRIAMLYSIANQPAEATDWLIQATAAGYNSLNDVDSLDVFKNLRSSTSFKEIRLKLYQIVFPCSKEPRNHDFDFWIGDWNCYRTGTELLSGYSHVEAMAGGCAILENYTAVQAYSGKSFNFYDTAMQKWEQDWIGSGGASDRQRYYNGQIQNGNMHFTYETTNPSGDKIKGRFIFYRISSDSVRQYQDVTDDQGKVISVTYDLTYLRKN